MADKKIQDTLNELLPEAHPLMARREAIKKRYRPLKAQLDSLDRQLLETNDQIDSLLVEKELYEPISLLQTIYEKAKAKDYPEVEICNISLILSDNSIISLYSDAEEQSTLTIAIKEGWGHTPNTLLYTDPEEGVWHLDLATGNLEHWRFHVCEKKTTAIGFFNCLIFPAGSYTEKSYPIPFGVQSEVVTSSDTYLTDIPDTFFPPRTPEQKEQDEQEAALFSKETVSSLKSSLEDALKKALDPDYHSRSLNKKKKEDYDA